MAYLSRDNVSPRILLTSRAAQLFLIHDFALIQYPIVLVYLRKYINTSLCTFVDHSTRLTNYYMCTAMNVPNTPSGAQIPSHPRLHLRILKRKNPADLHLLRVTTNHDVIPHQPKRYQQKHYLDTKQFIQN